MKKVIWFVLIGLLIAGPAFARSDCQGVSGWNTNTLEQNQVHKGDVYIFGNASAIADGLSLSCALTVTESTYVEIETVGSTVHTFNVYEDITENAGGTTVAYKNLNRACSKTTDATFATGTTCLDAAIISSSSGYIFPKVLPMVLDEDKTYLFELVNGSGDTAFGGITIKMFDND